MKKKTCYRGKAGNNTIIRGQRKGTRSRNKPEFSEKGISDFMVKQAKLKVSMYPGVFLKNQH